MSPHRPGLRTRTRRILTALTMALITAFVPASLTSPAGATTTHVPTCTGIGRFTGQWVWGNTATDHDLARGIDTLICAAADYSTIDIKSWFLVDDDTLVNGMVSRLRLMHRYHHVHVNVLVGYTPRHAYSSVQKVFSSFAHVAICHYSCMNRRYGAVSHSKWITVSRLRSTGATAVMSTSSNWSDRQFTLSESAMLSVGDRALYNAFVGDWSTLSRCVYRRCTPPHTGKWLGSGSVHVMFFPVATGDAVADELARAGCRRGGSLRLSSLFLNRTAVVRQLELARTRGCVVRVVLGEQPDARTTRALTPHVGRIHDKMLLIYTPRVREVISGSANFTWSGLRSNDEQLVRVTTYRIVTMYRSFFDHVWSHTPVGRTAAARIAAAVVPAARASSTPTAPAASTES